MHRRLWHRLMAGCSSFAKHTSLVPAAILTRPKTPNCASRMQRLLEFIGNHPYLVAAAVLAAIVVLAYELRARVQAFAALSAAQAVRLMNQGALVIDLRSKDLFDAGPAAEIESQADSLKKWRDKNVITYCDSGANGASAARALMKLGFTKVFNLQGGLNAWVKDNLPLAKTAGGKSSSK
jgi:rhodanese-related sulfurtransferase